MFKVVKREEMSEGNVILNEIEAPMIARKAKPGQFVILKANEDGQLDVVIGVDSDSLPGGDGRQDSTIQKPALRNNPYLGFQRANFNQNMTYFGAD